jgi:hypothetical protein
MQIIFSMVCCVARNAKSQKNLKKMKIAIDISECFSIFHRGEGFFNFCGLSAIGRLAIYAQRGNSGFYFWTSKKMPGVFTPWLFSLRGKLYTKAVSCFHRLPALHGLWALCGQPLFRQLSFHS